MKAQDARDLAAKYTHTLDDILDRVRLAAKYGKNIIRVSGLTEKQTEVLMEKLIGLGYRVRSRLPSGFTKGVTCKGAELLLYVSWEE